MFFSVLVQVNNNIKFDQNKDLLDDAKEAIGAKYKGFNSGEVKCKKRTAGHNKEKIRDEFALVAEKTANRKNEKSGIGHESQNGYRNV